MKKTLLLAFLVIGAVAASALLATSGQAAMQPDGYWETIYDVPGLSLGTPGERMVASDGAGALRMVYDAGGLYYARRTPAGWVSELVDPESGFAPSLAVDPAGKDHVCYGGPANSLRHAWRDASGWHIETITSDFTQGRCSISVGRDGYLAVAYGPSLKIAYRDAAGWKVLSAPDGHTYEPSLAVWDKDNLHVAFTVGTTLWYAGLDAGGWHSETIGGGWFTPSLALTSAGVPYIAEYGTGGKAYLLWRGTAGWQGEPVGDEETSSVSLVMGPGDEPYVALGGQYHDLRLARRTSSGWNIAEVPTDACSTFEAGLTLAFAAGKPVVARQAACDYLLRTSSIGVSYLDPDGSKIAEDELVAESHSAGLEQQLAVDVNGRAHALYSRGTVLNYARQEGTSWFVEEIPGASLTCAFAVDGESLPHLAFAGEAGLQYGGREADGWRFEMVAGEAAGAPALLLAPDGLPVLAWVAGDALRLARKVGGAWSVLTIASSASGDPALSWGPGGRLHIAYADAARHSLVAYEDRGRWYKAYPAPLSALADPFHAALAYDGANALAFAGTRAGGYNLSTFLSVRSGRQWAVEELDPSTISSAVALAVDSPAGDPSGVIAAAYARQVEIVYARRLPGGWQREVVAAMNDDGWPDHIATSLAFDSAGHPYVGYYNADKRGFRIARWSDSAPTPTATPMATATAASTATPTVTPTVTPTQPPSSACATTPTPRPPYIGVPPASGSIERQVSHCADDTYSRIDTGENLYDLAYVRMGARNDGAIPYVSGILFRDVRIPRGAQITSARLRMQPAGNYSGGAVTVSIAGQLAALPADFNPANAPAQGRSRTSARVAWALPADVTAATDSPDIKAIVQEVVALPDWKPGNDIAILIDATAATTQWLNWHAFDGKPQEAGQLLVTYAPASQ